MQTANHWLHKFSVLTVVAAFVLILVGSLVTTDGAGMAFADWPLSNGSVNPHGWWFQSPQRLEHGHRLLAEFTACLVGILCAWTWESLWSVPVAFIASGLLAVAAYFAGVSPQVIALIGLCSAVVIFTVILFWKRGDREYACAPLVRWLAFIAFCGVVAQAVMGGLRVMLESSGNTQAALVFRIAHGCFAQIEFGLLVVIVSTLTQHSQAKILPQIAGITRLRTIAWITFGFIFLQLIVGATMRHMGAGLAIPSFPKASPTSWMPAVHNAYIDINFTHTRVLVLLVLIHVFLLVKRVFRSAGGVPALTHPALLLVALIVVQVGLGMSVIWTFRKVVPTTLHVINGAAIFATSLLLAVRASRFACGESEAGVTALPQNIGRAAT